jgi:hypothetical protein
MKTGTCAFCAIWADREHVHTVLVRTHNVEVELCPEHDDPSIAGLVADIAIANK